ncbi:MAG: ArsR/SmtB family transcription factor [Acetivibrionales bacterium]
MDLEVFEKKAEKLKAIAHPHRLCIVKGLMENECNVTKIQKCLELPQSTVSQHLARLKSAGIIKGRRHGLEVCYYVVDKEVIDIMNLLMMDNKEKNI